MADNEIQKVWVVNQRKTVFDYGQGFDIGIAAFFSILFGPALLVALYFWLVHP